MSAGPISRNMEDLLQEHRHLLEFIARYVVREGVGGEVSDLTMGNPQEMPVTGFAEALAASSEPRDPHWYAYKQNEPEATATVTATLRESHGLQFEQEDVFMTTGAFAGLLVSMAAILDPGDEVIYVSPPWFFYALLVRASGGTPVRVMAEAPKFDLPLEAVEAAITPRTRAVIVNSPNNPTGRIYGRAALEGLARILTEASHQHGRPIFILSDESYSRIVYDDRTFVSPTAVYPNAFLIYTYGKTLLTPGARLGYLAIPPTMPDRGTMRMALSLGQVATGYSFPSAVLMHALPDIEPLSVDVKHLQRRRDRMAEILGELGYEFTLPEGTFYVMVKAPIEDDFAFTDLLADNGVLVLPGSVVDLPGFFRISLTATDEMIERSRPGFEAALKKASA